MGTSSTSSIAIFSVPLLKLIAGTARPCAVVVAVVMASVAEEDAASELRFLLGKVPHGDDREFAAGAGSPDKGAVDAACVL